MSTFPYVCVLHATTRHTYAVCVAFYGSAFTPLLFAVLPPEGWVGGEGSAPDHSACYQGLNAALEGRTEGRAPEPEPCGGGGRQRQTGGWWGEGEGVAVGPWGSGSRGLKLQEAAFLLGSPTILPPIPCPTLATRQGSAKAWPGRAQPCTPASGPHPTPSLGILSSLCAAPTG